MSDKTVSDLSSATLPLSGSDVFLVRQPAESGSKTRKITKTDLVSEMGGGGGATAFTDLTDVPNSYTGQTHKVVRVKVDETGLEFATPSAGGGGSVNSGVATLASGTVVVSSSSVAAETVVVVTPTTAPSTAGTALYVDPANFVVATSFTISSDDAADARDVFWMQVDPAPSAMVLFADATSADAYVTKDWGSDESETWLSFGIAFHSAALTFWNGDSGSGVLGLMLDNIDGPKCMLNIATTGADTWFYHGSPGSDIISSPAPLAGVWQDCEMHFLASGTCELYINTALVGSFVDGGNTTRKVSMGQYASDPNADSLVYIRNVKVGTTRGGTDLFADDFASGDLSNWGSTTGACSVIPDPF